MSNVFWEMLAQHAGSGSMEKLSPPLQQRLRNLSKELDLILTISASAARAEILNALCAEVFAHLPELEAAAQETNAGVSGDLPTSPAEVNGIPRTQIDPEILECARRGFNEEEFIAGMREIEETGGLVLEDFIHEVEQAALPDE